MDTSVLEITATDQLRGIYTTLKEATLFFQSGNQMFLEEQPQCLQQAQNTQHYP